MPAPPLSLNEPYRSGKASVAHGSTDVTGVGDSWVQTIEEGDLFYAQGFIAYIAEQPTQTGELKLDVPWEGPTLSNDDYVIYRISWKRYDPSIMQVKLRQLLAKYAAFGALYFVEGSEPDPQIGDDGDFAIKVNTGIWKLWRRVEGVWIYQGVAAGISWQGMWDEEHSYMTNDMVARLGKNYISLVNDNLGNQPESSPDEWELVSQGGSRHEIQLDASDRPDNGDTFRRIVMTAQIMFPNNLTESQAWCGTPSTADAEFVVYRINNTDQSLEAVGTIMFHAGQHYGVFDSDGDVIFEARDVLVWEAPDPRDATLADVAITMVGYRS